MSKISRIVSSGMVAGAIVGGGGLSAFAAEEGKSVYLLGVTTSMAGLTPPPGTYVSSFKYGYSGEGTGGAAISRTLSRAGTEIPHSATLQLNADVKVEANVAIDILSALWVAPQKVMGGLFGVGVLMPIGYQEVNATLTSRGSLTFPNGTTLPFGRTFNLSDDTFAAGDPLGTAFLGWNDGNWHWKVAGMINVPVGSYSTSGLVNMGFNRWAADLTGSMTYLNPQTGFEVSLAAGFTFNGENPDTNYKTGTEFHLEGAVMQHLSKAFSIGVAGYHYQQVTGDSGAGALLGDFKGEVSAIGPNVTYNFQVGSVPVLTSVRWMHEFNATNRLEGDAGFLTVTIPLGGAPAH